MNPHFDYEHELEDAGRADPPERVWETRAHPARADGVIVEEVPFCGCTNEELERGRTCGQEQCPNRGER